MQLVSVIETNLGSIQPGGHDVTQTQTASQRTHSQTGRYEGRNMEATDHMEFPSLLSAKWSRNQQLPSSENYKPMSGFRGQAFQQKKASRLLSSRWSGNKPLPSSGNYEPRKAKPGCSLSSDEVLEIAVGEVVWKRKPSVVQRI
jgi:hypothetical protein